MKNFHWRLIIVLIILFNVSAGLAAEMFPQSPNKGMMQPKSEFGSPATMGEVLEFDGSTVTISDQHGGKKQLLITSRTQIVKQSEIEAQQLKKGDKIQILGLMKSGSDLLPQRIIVLAAEAEKSTRTTQFSGKPGFNAAGPINQIPGIATITELNPMTVTFNSGETKTFKLTQSTIIMREEPVNLSEVAQGVNVRAITAPDFGEGGGGLMKIIILSKRNVPMAETLAETFETIPTRATSAVKYADSPFGFLTAPPQPDYLFDLNVNWVVTGIRIASWEEIEPEKGVYDFSSVDQKLKYLFDNGLNTMIELRAINPIYGTYSGKKGVKGDSFPEEYMAEWSIFVEKFVERYDGDGTNDAPGSPVVKNYQLIHELLMPGHKKKSFWRENPDKYAKFFQITYDAVRKACNNCNLYFTGGFEEDFMFKGEKSIKGQILEDDGFFIKVLGEFQEQGARFKNIGFDYHYWSFWLFRPGVGQETYRDPLVIINHIKKLYKSFGYTEDEVAIISKESGVNGYMESEREQAIYIPKVYALSLASGQKHLFWTSIVEYTHEAGLFKGMGLVHNQENNGYSHKKLAYYTYKLLIDKLNDTDWGKVETILDGVDNVYVYKFPKKNGKSPVYIAWWDYFREKGEKVKDMELELDIKSKVITVTTTTPNAENGQDIKNKATFNTVTTDVKNGRINIVFGQDPLLIEEGVLAPSIFYNRKVNPYISGRLPK